VLPFVDVVVIVVVVVVDTLRDFSRLKTGVFP